MCAGTDTGLPLVAHGAHDSDCRARSGESRGLLHALPAVAAARRQGAEPHAAHDRATHGTARRGTSAARQAVAVLSIALGSTAFCAEPLEPIPADVDTDPAKVELGKRLFNDPRLSKDGTVSCASCHDLANGGDDGRAVSLGVDGKPGVINSPTVFNVRFNIAQFWDGRAETLEEQIDGPIQSEIEMANLWPDVITTLNED